MVSLTKQVYDIIQSRQHSGQTVSGVLHELFMQPQKIPFTIEQIQAPNKELCWLIKVNPLEIVAWGITKDKALLDLQEKLATWAVEQVYPSKQESPNDT